jgi:hypothetical protein
LVRARIALHPVDSAAAHVALHRSARNRGYKLSREGTDPRSLRGRCVCCLSEVCAHRLKESVSINPPRCGPCLPFYSFQGEGSGYICGKKVKWGKDEREKQKRWPRVRPSSSLIRCEQLPL